MNKDTTVGIFKFSLLGFQNMIDPTITENMGSMSEFLKDLPKSTLTLANTVENGKFKSNVLLDLKGLAAIQVNSVTTPKTSSAIIIPSVKENEAILIGSVQSTEGQTKLQKQYASDAQNYLLSLRSKDKDLADLLNYFEANK